MFEALQIFMQQQTHNEKIEVKLFNTITYTFDG